MTAITAQQWRDKAKALKLRRLPFIDGKFSSSQSDESFVSNNPATGDVLCELPVGSTHDVDKAVRAARRTVEDRRWSNSGPLERKAKLLRVADLIEANAEELSLLDSLEVGKAITSARAELSFSTSLFRFYAETTDKLQGSVAATDRRILGLSLLEPRGVVGAIVPWNFPLLNASLKAAPALAAGNSVVLKPSELSSLSALRLAELVLEAGIPEGVLNVLPGLGATVGDAIARHVDIDFLSFTGSTATGRRLMIAAGESNGKPLIIECGGKSAQIVCADLADALPAVAEQVVADAFWNVGQWCAARSRLLVEASLQDALLEAIVSEAAKLVPGDPLEPTTNFGTIASAQQFERVQGFVDQAIEQGAKVATAATRNFPCKLSMSPVIFSKVAPDADVFRREVFGPVLTVTSFKNFDEAISLANATDYGLSASVWTRDATRSQRSMREVKAGRVVIKGTADACEPSIFAHGAEPWGASGFGMEFGMEGLRSYTRTKAVEFVY